MGTILEMTRIATLAAACLAAFGLSACGNQQNETSPLLIAGQTLYSSVMGDDKSEPAAPVTRADLAKLNVPVIRGEITVVGMKIYLVPIAANGDAATWSTSDDLTVTFRNGVMVQTRGVGPDLMQASAPSLSQLQNGAGNHQRSYTYLDGGDQLVRYTYDCSVRFAGAETITVVGQQHSTRHVIEDCTGKWAKFSNEYWFENGGKLRKSKELLVPEWGYMVLERVIDRG